MKTEIIKRTHYLNQVFPFVNKPVIKVITGIRRCGKSYLLKQIIEALFQQGVSSDCVVYINKELMQFDFIKDYQQLYSYIDSKINRISGKKYIFIDEIQEIEAWEKAVSSLFAENDFDIYLTGSNAKLLSSEIATLLSGRYIEFNLYPLSFIEFLEFEKDKAINYDESFIKYLRYGGFPVIHHFNDNEELIFQYLGSLYNTILLKDIISRYNVRNVQLFENLTKFVFDNIGNIFSGRSITAYLKSQNQNVGTDTIQNYLQYLEDSFVVRKAKRYDIKAKKLLDVYEKYYLTDLGLKNSLLGYRENDIAGMLENIVYLKLIQCGYKVYIGKFDNLEIDFFAQKADSKYYFQVAYLISTQETFAREILPLQLIADNHPKYILSMDKMPATNNDGIRRTNIIQFLREFV